MAEPKTIGGYKILEQIGEGGSGVVYKALNQFNKPVALKVLKKEYIHNSELCARFAAEAELLSTADHPSILKIYSSGCDDGNYFCAAKYYKKTLEDELKGEVSTSQRAFSVSIDILEALEYLGDQCMHLDIKPSNIFISEEDHAVLGDFGLFSQESHGQTTMTKLVAGTPGYMAPELLEGKADHRSDIYSVGAVLYRMLTGKLPTGRFARPSSYNDSISSDLDAVILRSLSGDTDKRYQSAVLMREALQSCRADSEQGVASKIWSRIKESVYKDEDRIKVMLYEIPKRGRNIFVVPKIQDAIMYDHVDRLCIEYVSDSFGIENAMTQIIDRLMYKQQMYDNRHKKARLAEAALFIGGAASFYHYSQSTDAPFYYLGGALILSSFAVYCRAMISKYRASKMGKKLNGARNLYRIIDTDKVKNIQSRRSMIPLPLCTVYEDVVMELADEGEDVKSIITAAFKRDT